MPRLAPRSQSAGHAVPPRDTGFITSILLGALLAQAALSAFTLPVTSFFHTDWNSRLVDNPYHWYQIRLAQALLKDGFLVGYDPRFAAGYIGGLPFNPSAKFPTLITILLARWLPESACYKLYLFGAPLLAGVCVPLAAYWLRFSRPVIAIAAALGVALWWASGFHWFFTVGMVSFPLAVFCALPFFVRLRLLLERGSAPGAAIGLGIAGAFGFFLHPLFPLMVLFLVLPDAALHWRRYLAGRSLVDLALVGGFSLAPNLVWILPTLGLHGIIDDNDPYQKAVSALKIVREALGIWRGNDMGAKIDPLLLLLSGIAIGGALAGRDRSERAQLLAALGVSWALTVLYGAFGAAIPALAHFQPNRFGPAAYLILILPAAQGVETLVAALRARRPGRWRIPLGAAAALSFAIALFVANEVRREVSWAPIGHYGKLPPETAPLGEMSQWILDFLHRDTDASGRVLFETSLARVHDGGHMAGYYALQSNREFIGGPYPYTFFAGAWDGWMFGKPIGEHSHAEFAGYLDLYNIHWLIVHSDATKQYLREQPGLEQVQSRFGIALFRVTNPATFFAHGSGKVESATDHLTLTDLSNGGVVLKYHYDPGFAADPPVAIEPVALAGDPEPFIRLRNGSVQDVRLTWSSRR